ncbi:hypothetical protein GCM10010483_13620 [Actinokineospora diospyrosa]
MRTGRLLQNATVLFRTNRPYRDKDHKGQNQRDPDNHYPPTPPGHHSRPLPCRRSVLPFG